MNIQRKTSAALLSILSNALLVIIKLVVGILGGSVSIMSEAIHSGIDLLAACIAWLAILVSAKPADMNHPYGHGKFENLSGTIEALLIFLAAVWIIYEAMHKLLVPQPIEKLELSILVMGLSAFVNLIISNYLMKIGKETDSIALTADAWHLRTDVYTSVGVMSALIVILGGKYFYPNANLIWMDPCAAIIVAILIIQAAYKLTKQASHDLVDVSLPDIEVQWLCNYMRSLAPIIRGFHNLRTRKAGSYRFIEMHMVVDGNMTVNVSHEITKRITREVIAHFAGSYIVIHVEPCNQQWPSNACSPNCIKGCLVRT